MSITTAGLAIISGLSTIIFLWFRLRPERETPTQPQCTPSRKPITQRTNYAGRKYRWQGLERSLQEKVEKDAILIGNDED